MKGNNVSSFRISRLRLLTKVPLVFAGAALLVSLARADITSDLVMKFDFDESSGTIAKDSSGNGNNASLINFPTDATPYWIKGRIGGALEFCADNGDDDQVVTDNPVTLANQDVFTFAFWAKRKSDNNPYNPRLVGPVRDTDGQYWVLWAPGTGVGFYPPSKSPEPVRDVWQHFVVTYTRTNGAYVLYVNAAKAAQGKSNDYLKNEAGLSQWVIGHKELLNDNRDPWRGYLDDVRVYNRILSEADIKELYQQAPPLPPSVVKQPQPGSYYQGETIQLSTVVDGTPPITYKWLKNSNPIPGATNSTLVFTSVQTSDAGDYSVVVGNVGGDVTSSVAKIDVLPVASITSGLAGYWKFDESTGAVAADSSSRGNAGTVYPGDAQWTASGQVGRALSFRGPDNGGDYVVIPSFPGAKATMTLSAWVFAEARPNRARIACGGSGGNGIGQFMLNLDGDTGDLHGYILNSAAKQSDFREGAANPIPTNQWQHVALVADGAVMRVFRNGTEIGETAYDGTLFQATNAFSIGARLAADDSGPESGWWQGKLDDIGYWTRGLTPSEIASIYAAGAAKKDLNQADQYATVAPINTQVPQGTSLVAGNALVLKSMVTGTLPLNYQWKKGGQAIAGATNATYQLSAAATSDAGEYTLTVSNTAGSKTTDPVVVNVSDPPVDLTSGLVLYLNFDETSGTTAHDTSGKANNASLINFPTDKTIWVPGMLGGALLFNQADSGSDDQVITDGPINLANQNQFSFAFWAKALPFVSGFNPRVVSPLNVTHWILWKPGSGIGIWDQVPVTVEPTGDAWHHFGVIFDRAAKSYSVYVDGTRRADGWSADRAEPGAVQWIIGHHENPDNVNGDNWGGALDDLRIYNRLLTPKEMLALYNLAQPPSVSVNVAGASIQISWAANLSGYVLESSPTLPGTTWTTVPGAANNSVTITPSARQMFYRLHK